MKIHQQNNKVQVVTEVEKLAQIAICLSESHLIKNQKLALEISAAMEDLNMRSGK